VTGVRRALRIASAGATLWLALVQPLAAGFERIPVDHWCYPALERFESLGLCSVPESRPLGRVEIAALVYGLEARAGSADLSARDRWQLDRLVREFTATTDPRERWDRQLYAEDGRLALEADFDLTPYVEQAPFNDEVEAYVASDPTLKVHIGDHITYDLRYHLLFGPEHGDRARQHKPSRREKSFKGLTSLYERSYAVGVWDPVEVLVGRDHVDWGPGGGLIVPGDGYSIDQIGFRLRFKSLRLDAFYGQLFTDPERYMVGHRLEGRFGDTVVGLSETVVYGGRPLDWLYLFPLSWYYANQYNERTNEDNILWSVDAKTVLMDRVTLFANLLLDDIQFEREDGYPDKIAFDVGARWVPARPLGLSVGATYRFVDLYTYSHHDSLSIYVSGGAELDRGDVLLGGLPGPDSDEWRADVSLYPRPNLALDLGALGRRVGEGNDLRAFDLGIDSRDPDFPSGIVEETTAVIVGLRWELEGDRHVSLAWAHAQVDNRGHVAGADDSDDSFRLEIRWDIP